MVSAPDSESKGKGFESCCIIVQDTLLSQFISLSTSRNGYCIDGFVLKKRTD